MSLYGVPVARARPDILIPHKNTSGCTPVSVFRATYLWVREQRPVLRKGTSCLQDHARHRKVTKQPWASQDRALLRPLGWSEVAPLMWLRLAFRSRCTSRCRARCGSATPFCFSPRRDRASSTLTCPGAHRACTTAVCLSATCVRTASSALAPRSMQRHFSWPFISVGSSVLACTVYHCIVSYFSSDGPVRCCAGNLVVHYV